MFKITLNQWIIINQTSWISLFGGTDTRTDLRLTRAVRISLVSLWTPELKQECRKEGYSRFPRQLPLPQVLDWFWVWLSHQPQASWSEPSYMSLVGRRFLLLACCDASLLRSTGSSDMALKAFLALVVWLVLCLLPECHNLWRIPWSQHGSWSWVSSEHLFGAWLQGHDFHYLAQQQG